MRIQEQNRQPADEAEHPPVQVLLGRSVEPHPEEAQFQAAANSRSTLLGLKLPLPRSSFTPSVFMARVRTA